MPADSMMAANKTETSARSRLAALLSGYLNRSLLRKGGLVTVPGQSGPDQDLGCSAAFAGDAGTGQRVPNRD